jgi:hypothetical protein
VIVISERKARILSVVSDETVAIKHVRGRGSDSGYFTRDYAVVSPTLRFEADRVVSKPITSLY